MQKKPKILLLKYLIIVRYIFSTSAFVKCFTCNKIKISTAVNSKIFPFIFILLFSFGRENDDTTYIPE